MKIKLILKSFEDLPAVVTEAGGTAIDDHTSTTSYSIPPQASAIGRWDTKESMATALAGAFGRITPLKLRDN